jgi:hypothetical protein
MINFKVKQGIIHINSIDIFRATDDLIHFSVDCKQKYPTFLWWGETLILKANRRVDEMLNLTLNVDDWSLSGTQIDIEGLSEELKLSRVIHIEVEKYTVDVVMVKRTRELIAQWTDDGNLWVKEGK